MFNLRYTSMIIISAVLQSPIGSKGEESNICYIKKKPSQTGLCVRPSTVMCCNRLSVDRIDVYGRSTCNSSAKCGDGHGCCESRDILKVSEEYVASLEQTFRRTHCFNEVNDYPYQLPDNNGLVLVVVSYSCTATIKESATSTTSVTSSASTFSTASTTSTESVTRTVSATTTASTQPQLKTIGDERSNVVIALAVSLTIVSVAFVVVVTVMCLKRHRATLQTSMSMVDGSGTIVHDPVQASTSGTQYVNVVPPTYEQLSRQHTDGVYTEMSKDEHGCTHGELMQQGQQLGSRSVYYNDNGQAGHDGAYVIVA